MYYFQKETKWQKDLIKQISKELNIDTRVVREIVYYSLLYLKVRIAHPQDETPVRIRQLGVWDLKTTRNK